ncbi:hypothetical protein D3C75_1051560 [compost metagenome]
MPFLRRLPIPFGPVSSRPALLPLPALRFFPNQLYPFLHILIRLQLLGSGESLLRLGIPLKMVIGIPDPVKPPGVLPALISHRQQLLQRVIITPHIIIGSGQMPQQLIVPFHRRKLQNRIHNPVKLIVFMPFIQSRLQLLIHLISSFR